MIQAKFDIIQALKDAGYNTAVIRDHKLFSEATMSTMRHGSMAVSIETLNRLCIMLDLQPGDVIECVPGDGESEELRRYRAPKK